MSRTTLQANQRAASEARAFVREALDEQAAAVVDAPQAITEEFDEVRGDAELLVSELATNAVMHAGTDIDVICSLEQGQSHARPQEEPGPSAPADDEDVSVAVIIEVADRHPTRALRPHEDLPGRRGLGLRIVDALASSWGVTYDQDEKSVWFRLEIAGQAHRAAPEPTASPRRALRDFGTDSSVPAVGHSGLIAEWPHQAGPTFLAEGSELLAGQLDEDLVAALAGQLLVPRLADWCGVWLTVACGRMRLSQVWHAEEWRIDELRHELAREMPPAVLSTASIPWPWPETAGDVGTRGSALAFPLVSAGACQGMLLLGRTGQLRMTDNLANVVQDVARRIAQSLVTARRYTRQKSISRALQRNQLPDFLASIPGVETAIVYEPYGEGQTVGGDFYDLFPMGERSWGFLLGDVQGKDPEAMSVTGLARYLVRLLAREGHGVESVLRRLNAAMAEESAEAVVNGGERARPRFLSMLYGELQLGPGTEGPHCTIASAGHPLPLRLLTDGSVVAAAEPQMLLGIDDSAVFEASSFSLAPGETLLCVTDGVTERRNGHRQLDDGDGLSSVLCECAGLGAKAVAERIRRTAHDFGPDPVEDDLSVLVLQALPVTGAQADTGEHRPG
ncbi:ATP-binding SpoIIE family protein phosphatase [Streptomyces sp. NPDC006678]|uniref:ATP-binding SpoIIE family protein phosphatase n=1 Tax=Streptomyces sp. NPDC006678 TaxID=3157185 RepID=UPI0033EDD70B